LNAVRLRNGLANAGQHICTVAWGVEAARIHFGDQQYVITTDAAGYRHRGDRALANCRIQALGRPFDILWKMLGAPDDQQILEAACDMQVAVSHDP
jgi:hypothetical protein